MNIPAISSYSNNLNYQYTSKKTNPEPEIKNEDSLQFGQIKVKKASALKVLAAAVVLGIYTLLSACSKEPEGPHPSGYVRPDEPVVSHDGYPEDAPDKVKQEFREWYQANCPYYYWPDYTSPYPEGWEEEVQAFHNAILEWWHSHGYPDWNPNGNP